MIEIKGGETRLEGDPVADGRAVLALEAEAVAALAERLDERFVQAVGLVLACSGRVIATGMGKSGAVARKLAATLASTGTPALFLHPAEGVHGDLGMVAAGDVVIALSYRGESDELTAILPALGRLEVPIIAFTAQAGSTLGAAAEVVLDVAVPREACPLNLAPTTSTAAMLAMGDALAVAVMRQRRFGPEDFALRHPAGALGRRLLLRVDDVMRSGDMVALVGPETRVREVLFTITRAHAGAACVVAEEGRMLGIVTDGDLRRGLLADDSCLGRPAAEVMSAPGKRIGCGKLATEALGMMEKHQIGELPVLDDQGRVLGVVNLKDLLRAGIL